MKNKIIVFFGLLYIGLFWLNSCDKGDNDLSELSQDSDEVYLTPEQSEELANTETILLNKSDIVLPNGYTIEEFDNIFGVISKNSSNYSPYSRDVLIKKMTERALILTNNKNYYYNKGEGENEPAQIGLVYGAGLKMQDPTKREKPTAGNCNRNIRSYGLDCSGFIWQLFKSAGVTKFPVGNASNQSKPSVIKESIESAYPDVKGKLIVEDLEDKIGVDYLVTGDIIYWRDAGKVYHIGMILKDKEGNIAVAQSNGYWEDCKENKDKIITCGKCNENLHPDLDRPKVGPRFFRLTQANINSFSKDYGVVRIYTSDVKVTLTWDNMVDLDLHVVDPNGEEIFFDHPMSVSGGKLDIDNVDGFGPENIFWQDNTALIGEYKVYLNFYDGSLQNSNYKIRVQAFGKIDQTFNGTISYGEVKSIVNFDNKEILTKTTNKSSLDLKKVKKLKKNN